MVHVHSYQKTLKRTSFNMEQSRITVDNSAINSKWANR